ncbi:TetR/AcrR family transcriptional regulator [Streptomyces sp. NPDC014894]|uniref:TetR/AcrR family transcriptional regulator n=1 Tax=unclassified Streptomyces TaxID=2593676 RepID=UPI0036F53414
MDSEANSGRRSYDSLRRAAQARETRADIAHAARKLFLAQGWAATTVREVAREAGVSAPTVYATYGNKAGLAGALADAADLSADAARLVEELEEPGADPARQLAAMAGYDRRLFERAGDVIALVREAGRGEPALAATYREGRAGGDRTRSGVFSTWPPGVLREGLDVPEAVDVYAAICNIDVYRTLTVERGWPPERVERWWAGVLARELLSAGSRRTAPEETSS